MLDPLKSENCLGPMVKVPGLRWPVGTLESKCWIQSELGTTVLSGSTGDCHWFLC